MKMQGKIALVVMLVLFAGALLYFNDGGDPIKLGSQDAQDRTDDYIPLPGYGEPTPTPQVEPELEESPIIVVAGADDQADSEPTTPSALTKVKMLPEKEKSAITLDFGTESLAKEPTSQPAKRVGLAFNERARKTLKPNSPAKVAIDLKPHAYVGLRAKTATAQTTYVVKRGDTLFGIAEKHYGRGPMWTQIARANPGLKPSRLRVGQKLTIPARSKVVALYDGLTKATALRATKGTRPYKVAKGDSFYSIALEKLGAGDRWPELFKMNKARVGGSPRKLRAGQTILLPTR